MSCTTVIVNRKSAGAPNVFPQAVADVSAWLLFPGVYAVGSRSLDHYISVPETKLSLVMEIIAALNGKQPLKDIVERYRLQGREVDVPGLYERLLKAGLLIGSSPKTEMSWLFLSFVEVRIEPVFRALQRSITKSFVPLICATAMTIVIGIWIFFSSSQLFINLALQRIEVPKAPFFLLAIGGFVLSLSCHELGHALAATRYGLCPKRLSFGGYLIFIPLFVVRINNLYLVPPRVRMTVWGAGLWANLSLAGMSLMMVQLVSIPILWQQVLARLAIANGLAAFANMVPFLPNDGYFILSTLLRQPNIRPRAWQELKSWLLARKKPTTWLVIYCLITIIFVGIIVLRNAVRFYGIAHHPASRWTLIVLLATVVALRIRQRWLKHGTQLRQTLW